VDFELGFSLRCRLLAGNALDYYICADDPACLKILPGDVLHALVSRTLDYPIRQRPVYLEGVWGGYYTMKERHLPKEMKNCAWVFDLIPMEVSTVLIMDGREFEFPYYVLVAAEGRKLMGERCLKEFHGFFPIRFNYDDTFHSSGNMSIQLHPGADFVVPNHNELGRQDESYYIVATAQRARTYLGFNRGQDPEEFIREVKRSEKDYQPVDYQKYIYSVESKPGIQVMIPAGTIHGSGKNQLILEIGSLTVGSYTYKMYDYLRKDLDGKPRPIHTYFGNINLNRGMMQDYVEQHLVNGGYRVLREEGDAKEVVVGECEQLYFSLRNLIFGNYMTDDTKGDFHVLALVDGEDVTVRSKKDPSRKFDMKFMDIIVVPADFGEYELINNKPETWTTIHKTLLK
jgi:mannose-6-phosphate isomerase class I